MGRSFTEIILVSITAGRDTNSEQAQYDLKGGVRLICGVRVAGGRGYFRIDQAMLAIGK